MLYLLYHFEDTLTGLSNFKKPLLALRRVYYVQTVGGFQPLVVMVNIRARECIMSVTALIQVCV